MASYTIVVQPADNSGDHWLEANGAASADRFAKWVHKATGAAVSVHDFARNRDRMRLFGLPVIVSRKVPGDEIWLVNPRSGPADRRTDAERTVRVVNVKAG